MDPNSILHILITPKSHPAFTTPKTFSELETRNSEVKKFLSLKINRKNLNNYVCRR